MVERLRFLPAGSECVLVELEDLEATLTLLDNLLATRLEGVKDVVPAARTVLIRFDPLATDRERLAAAVSKLDLSARAARHGEMFDIPVRYDGEDLDEIAAFLGWSVEEVIRRHAAATFTVAFTGFAPGFAYMTCDDPGFDVPRRKSPRVKIPAGSVALAGKFGGIYPSDSPGGWQLLGTTPLRMWDTARERPALLAPGDRVRFHELTGESKLPAAQPPSPQDQVTSQSGGLVVTRSDRAALYQDLGRPGRADQGVSESGALDRKALREANLCVGNPHDAAAVEVTFGGFAVKADRAATLAVSGARGPITIRTTDGRELAAPFGHPFALDPGEELAIGPPIEGMRSYLALRGGFAVDPVLGSASTDTLAKIGPAPIVAGQVLAVSNLPTVAVDPERPERQPLPRASDIVTLDVVLGPRADWFTPRGINTLLAQDWQVTAESSRIGMRLAGAVPLERSNTAELPSEGTAIGSIQVPHSGQPVVFLADHPLTGGYPVIGVIASHHLDLVGQVPIGARIRFKQVTILDTNVEDTYR